MRGWRPGSGAGGQYGPADSQPLRPSFSGHHALSQLSQRCLALQQGAIRALAAAGGPGRCLGTLVAGGSGAVAVASAVGPALPAPSAPHNPHPPVKKFTDWGHEARKGTDTLILMNAACFVLQWLSKDVLTLWGAKVNALISAGQWWRLITPSFLHSSVIHLLVNSYALNSIGPHMELVSGHSRFTAIYVASGMAGTFLSFLRTPSPSLGASGAIFGLGAGLALFYYRHKEVLGNHSDTMLRSLGLSLVLNMGYSLLVKNVDNWGHVGGALGGALAAWLLGPCMVRNPETGRFVDRPPVRWFAFKEGEALSAAAKERRAKAQLQQQQRQQAKLRGDEAAGSQKPEQTKVVMPGLGDDDTAGAPGEGAAAAAGAPEEPKRGRRWPWRWGRNRREQEEQQAHGEPGAAGGPAAAS